MTAGLFSRVGETREVEGLLLPFGELSRPGNLTNTEPVMFSAASVTLPRDPSVVTLNEEHNRYAPLGRATALTITDAGVVAKFAIANTDEGDAYLASSSKRKLSAELGSIFRRGAQAVSSKLTGAAVCDEGSFASAALFSLPPGEEVMLASDTPASDEYVSPDRDNSSTTVTEFTDSEGVRWRRTEEYSSTSTVTKVTTDTDAETPAEDKTATEGSLMGNIVPGGAATTAPRRSLDGLFAAIASKDADAVKQYDDAGAAFALATLQHSGPGAATIAADTQESGYLGELWLRAPYQRRFIPLVTQKTLTNWRMQAWKWITLPEVADYAGNTAEVPSNAVDTEPVEVTANRLAGGERIDRRYEDFNDQAVIASFVEKQTDDYKRKTDGKLLSALVAAATATAPGSVPAGVAKGLAAIVDGALGVIASENRPGFAIVAADLWRDIALMKTNDKLAFLNAGFGLEAGDVDSFKIIPAPVGAGVGQIGAGRVYVGAKEAMQYFELGEAPIRVEGVVPGNGAKDIAVFGYWATLAVNAQAIRSVQTVA